MKITRRQVLQLGSVAGAALVAPLARAQRIATRVSIAQLKHGSHWDQRATGLRRLLWEVGKRTSIEVEADAESIDPCAPRLFYQPLAYVSVADTLPPFSTCAQKTLRAYLNHGGTLVVDAVKGGRGSGFEDSVRRAFTGIVATDMRVVERGHVIYKSFYLLDTVAGRSMVCSDLDAFELGGRLAIIVSHNDIGGAWARSNLGLWEHDVEPGGERQRERAFRLGINILMYALCDDYKEDQVHIPFILKRRRR